MPKDILMVSNGFGEAAVAGYIARALSSLDASVRIEHFPLVGGVTDSWPPLVGPVKPMPSGGLIANWNARHLVRDLRAGLAGLTWQQARYLRTQRHRQLVIAVGDVYCLAMCVVFAGRPAMFVATAKSELVAPHSRIESAIARRAMVTFTRDEQTANTLRAAGVNARYVGNVMMDGLSPAGVDLAVMSGALHIGILPGSRRDAPANAAAGAVRAAALARKLAPRNVAVQAFVSIPPSLDARAVHAALVENSLDVTPLDLTSTVMATSKSENFRLLLIKNSFADLLAASDVIFGQAGTANEQAAGLGKPVIAAPEPGERLDKMRWYRMRQQRLLGDALAVLPGDPETFAAGVLALLDDPARLASMRAAGRERMGGPGGAQAVARAALDTLEQLAAC